MAGLAHDGLDEDGGAEDAIDVTRVVAEEDAAKGGECAEQVGLPGDGRLDVLDVAGRVEGDGAPAAIMAILDRVRHDAAGGRRLVPKRGREE